MATRRRFGKFFWISLTSFVMIIITLAISGSYGFGIAFAGGNITIGNGQLIAWRWGHPDFMPNEALGYRGYVFEDPHPTLVYSDDNFALQHGRVRVPGWDWDLFHVVTPMPSLSTPTNRPIGVFIGLWSFAAICLMPIGLTFFRVLRQKRQVNQCRTCGYDLTANASGRCPECGELVQI